MRRRPLLPLLCLLGAGAAAAAGAAGASPGGASRLDWTVTTGAGYDTYIQRFPLAGVDTTETIAEFDLVATAEARTAGRTRHRWRLRPELSFGTELTREGLEAGWQYRPDSVAAVLRCDAAWHGRQYRRGTGYSLSSDLQEARAEARAILSPRGDGAVEARLTGWRLRYATPTTLELDHDEVGGGVYWKSGYDAERYFTLGARLAHRAYPDSAAIDRTVAGLAGELDTAVLTGAGVRLFWRSERRLVRDEAARPSAWSHWATAAWLAPAGAGRIETDLQGEVWRYDRETSAWFDSWRLAGTLLYHGGGDAGWGWLAGPTAERFDAGSDSPETYNQTGLRVGAEANLPTLGGACTVELGRRDYTFRPPPEPSAPAPTTGLDTLDLYSDFTYWAVWLAAAWSVDRRLSLDLAANWQPERHSEPADDAAVAFASARVVWRW
ncbi:MAG: hypothetical protein ACYDIE_03850 [Candidatus Krumholzibacteriia bacterium]